MLWSWFALAGLVGLLVAEWGAWFLARAAATSETDDRYVS